MGCTNPKPRKENVSALPSKIPAESTVSAPAEPAPIPKITLEEYLFIYLLGHKSEEHNCAGT